MDLAAKLRGFAGSSWNPLRVTDTALPPQLLLMAKLVVVGLVLRNYHLGFPDVFAPFFEWMEIFPAPWYRRAFKVAFLVCGTALLFNRTVRINCLILGSLFLLGTLSSKVYYRNAKVFVGLLLFLTGLQERGKPPWMIWWQLAIMYFGAGLNKILEADWRTGQYFDYFLTEIYHSQAYAVIRDLLPGRWIARLMCWSIIALEIAAGVMFTIRRLQPAAVWLAACVHVGAALLVAGDYGIYVAAVLASYMSLLPWPERLDASVDTVSPWRRVKGFFGVLDQDAIINWREHSQGSASLVLSTGQRRWNDWRALGWLMMWTPTLYFATMILMTAFSGDARVRVVRSSASVGVLILTWTLLGWLARRAPGQPRRSVPEAPK
jgi:hypothetical protein